jgi:hypothetical protein
MVMEGVWAGGEMTQALYAHMNNKIKKRKYLLKNYLSSHVAIMY